MKILTIIFLLAIPLWAVVIKPPFSKKDVQIYLQTSAATSTTTPIRTIPMVVNGKYKCPYIGSVYGPMDENFTCADAFVYHLVRVAANNKRALDCYYDYNQLSGGHPVTALNQKECPDILVSYGGMNFFAAVYFDELDDYRLYYFDMDVPKQVFQGDLEKFPKVQSQIQYRQKHMKKDKSKNEIVF